MRKFKKGNIVRYKGYNRAYGHSQAVDSLKPGRWRAKLYHKYFTITEIDGQIKAALSDEEGDRIDQDRYEFGNYFQYLEEAQKIANELNERLISLTGV